MNPQADAAAESLLRIWGGESPDPLTDVAPGPLAANERQQLIYRYMRRRQQIQAEIAAILTGTADMIAELERQMAGLDYLYGSKVQEAVRLELKGKAKSIKTPWGVAGFRTQPARLVVEDQAKLIEAWSAFQLPPECVKKVEREPEFKLVKAELDKLYEKGEIPPGCAVKQAEESFYTKLGGTA